MSLRERIIGKDGSLMKVSHQLTQKHANDEQSPLKEHSSKYDVMLVRVMDYLAIMSISEAKSILNGHGSSKCDIHLKHVTLSRKIRPDKWCEEYTFNRKEGEGMFTNKSNTCSFLRIS